MPDQIGKMSDQKEDLKGQMSCHGRTIISSTVIRQELNHNSLPAAKWTDNLDNKAVSNSLKWFSIEFRVQFALTLLLLRFALIGQLHPRHFVNKRQAFTDWLKKIRATFSANEKQNQNQSQVARAHFPALSAGCM